MAMEDSLRRQRLLLAVVSHVWVPLAHCEDPQRLSKTPPLPTQAPRILSLAQRHHRTT